MTVKKILEFFHPSIDKIYVVDYNKFVNIHIQHIVFQISTRFSYKTILEKTTDGSKIPSVVLSFCCIYFIMTSAYTG